MTFTERDAETGLDYFGARYFSGAQGRFTSPDQPFNDQDPRDPQSWNLYGYVRNNPLKYTDLNGEDCVYTSNQTDKSITVAVEQGSCSQKGGTFINGTVDMSALTYTGKSLDVGYTDPNGAAGVFSKNLGASVVEFPGIEGPENQAGAARIGSSGSLIGAFAAADAAFATSFASTYALPVIAAAVTAAGETGAVGPGVGLLNKIHHIFGNASHNLSSLVQQYGSQAAAYAALEKATTALVTAKGLAGQFQEVVNVGGASVTVRGAVVNGVVKIGTAFK